MANDKTYFRIRPTPLVIIVLLALNLIANTVMIWVLTSYKKHIVNYVQFENVVSRAIEQSVALEGRMKSVEGRTYSFSDHLIYNTNELNVLRKDYEKRFGLIGIEKLSTPPEDP